jgi:hypothetical protein
METIITETCNPSSSDVSDRVPQVSRLGHLGALDEPTPHGLGRLL